MSARLRVLLFVCAAWSAMVGSPTPAAALTPYRTWALGPRGQLYLTQDAYIPAAEIELPINGAEDLFITADGDMYIADAGNGRVLRVRGEDVVAVYGSAVLQRPTGVFVDEEGTLYVADAGNNTVVILDAQGNLIRAFGRPSEPLFGARTPFLPRKLAVNARRDIYIISEGSVNGVLHMNQFGRFLGYFGSNAADMSLQMILRRMFLPPEQLEQFVKTQAASPSNVTIDRRALMYTITAGTSPDKSIRKFTIAGRNIFPDVPVGSTSLRDVHISEDGLLTVVSAEGIIYEYTENGLLLFMFGAPDRAEQRRGTLRNPTGIARYGDRLFVLDKDKNALVVFRRTAFAKLVHEGVRRYVEGFYSEAQPFFEETLRYNGAFIMAYQGIADAHFKQGSYADALTAYRYAEDRKGYSEAFWELRNVVLQRYLTPFLGGLTSLFALRGVIGWLDRRRRWSARWSDAWRRWKQQRWVDDFIFLFRFIKQPADSFYYIKYNLRGSVGFAVLLYGWVVVVHLLTRFWTGFPFNPYASAGEVAVEREIVFALGALLLWNVANYLVSTISDGEGRFRDVFIGTAYSLFPFALFALPLTLFSNLLTLNEVFLFTFSRDLIWAWCALMLFIMVVEIHNYTLSQALRNVALTLFTAVIILLTAYVFFVLFNQLSSFVQAIIQEVGLRG
ncbi:MAG: YIP1 family protein [Anaerolineae bacterium]